MTRFYRSTEGLTIVLAVFVAAMFGLVQLVHAVGAPTLANSPVAILGILLSTAGVFLWADAAQRIVDALLDHFGGFINEVMSQ